MPDIVKIRIPFVYPIEHVPPKASKPRRTYVVDAVEAEVPSVGKGDAPVAVSFGQEELAKRRGFGGRLHAMVQGTTSLGVPSPEGGYLDLGRPDGTARFLYGSAGVPWEAKALTHAQEERPLGGTVVDDGRDRILRAVLERVSEFMFVEGEAWRTTRTPRFMVGESKEGYWYTHNSEGDPRSSYGMAMDRPEDFDELVSRIEERGGKIERDHRAPDTYDWDASSESEARFNAGYGGVLVIGSAGNCLGRLSSGTIMEIAKVAEAKNALWSGDGDPAAMFEALGTLAAQADANMTQNLRRHVAIASDAIVSSRDFSAVRLDEDDMDALTGLGA